MRQAAQAIRKSLKAADIFKAAASQLGAELHGDRYLQLEVHQVRDMH